MKRNASRPTSLRHFERQAAIEQIDQAADQHLQRRLALAQCLNGGLHALDVAAVIGAPDVDLGGEATHVFVVVIGQVGGEIGPGAVRPFEWTIHVIAIGGRLEQQLRQRLPILVRFAFGRRQGACVEQTERVEACQCGFDLALLDQRPLR